MILYSAAEVWNLVPYWDETDEANKDQWINIDDLRTVVIDILAKFDNHRKSNDLWRLEEDSSWSLAESWIEKAFKGVLNDDTKD